MRDYLKFYIDGQWVDPVELRTLDVDNPTTEQVGGKIALGSSADVDKAVLHAHQGRGIFAAHRVRKWTNSPAWTRPWPSTTR